MIRDGELDRKGDLEGEGEDEGSRVHWYSAIVECSGRIQWKILELSKML